jgi:hypothetical protein
MSTIIATYRSIHCITCNPCSLSVGFVQTASPQNTVFMALIESSTPRKVAACHLQMSPPSQDMLTVHAIRRQSLTLAGNARAICKAGTSIHGSAFVDCRTNTNAGPPPGTHGRSETLPESTDSILCDQLSRAIHEPAVGAVRSGLQT